MVIALTRTVILYLLIITGVRLMGKRQVGELEPSELVVSLLIADLAAVPMQDFGIPLFTGIIPIFALLSMTMIFSVLTMKNARFRILMCGKPSIVVRNGELDQREMLRNRYTVDELFEELRMKGCTDLTTIKYAILETNGQLSILPYAANQPPNATQLSVKTQESGLPVILISDGRLMDENLQLSGHDRNWLDKQLRKHNCPSPADVFLLTVDEAGKVYCSLRQEFGDKEPPS